MASNRCSKLCRARHRYCYGGYSLPVVGHCTLACSARRFNLMALYNMGFHDAKLAWGNWDYVDLSHFSNIPPGGELRTSAVMFVKECREKAHPPGLFASVASFTAGIALHRMWHHQKKSEKVTIPRLVELPNRKACSEVPPSNWALPLVLKCSGAAVLVMAASRKVRKRIWKGARLLDLKERNVSRASSTPSEAPSPVPVAPAHSVDGSVWREAVGGAPHPRVQEAPTCIPWTSQNVHVRAAPAVPAAGADKGDKPVRDGKPQADKTVASMKPEAEEADKIPPPAVKPAKPEAEETPPPVDVKPEVDKIPSTDVKPEAEETPPMDVKPEVDTSLESKAMLNEGASKGKGPQGKGPPLKGKGKGKMPSQSPPEGKGSTGKAAIRALVEAAKQQTELPEPRNRKWSAPKSTGTSLLDTSRATNLAIMLKKLPVCPAEFCECVKMLDSSHSQIAVGHVELVLANMPSQSEAHKLLSYDGNEGPLRDVEAEVLPLCSLSASAVKVFKIAMEHEDVYARHMARCRTISNAAQEVCRSRELRELLTLILHTGKYINSGAPGANAAETFTVESLQSLSTFKIGPISALHFLCISFRGMKREFLQLLLSNLRHVHAAAKEKFGQLDVDIHSSFQDDVKAVENRLEQVKQEVREQCHYERLAMLATQMTSELAALRTSFASAKQLVAEAQAYCDGAPRESMPAELFFQHVATFLGIFQATWEEIDAQPAKWRKYLSEAVTASALSNDITAWAQQLARQSIKDKHEVPSRQECIKVLDAARSLFLSGLKLNIACRLHPLVRQTSSEADISSSGHAFSDVSSVSNAEAKKLKFPAMNFVGIHADQANHSPLPSNLPTRSPSPTLRVPYCGLASAYNVRERPKSRSPSPRRKAEESKGSVPVTSERSGRSRPRTSSQHSQSTAPPRSKSPQSRSPVREALMAHTPTWGRASSGSAEELLSSLSLSYSGQSGATSRSVSPAPNRVTTRDGGDKGSFSESSASSPAASPRQNSSSRAPSAGSHGGHVGSDFLPDISRDVHATESEEASVSRAQAPKPRADDLCEFHVLHDEAGQASRQSGFEQMLRRLGVRRAPEQQTE